MFLQNEPNFIQVERPLGRTGGDLAAAKREVANGKHFV
jgi:hypothetical protein